VVEVVRRIVIVEASLPLQGSGGCSPALLKQGDLPDAIRRVFLERELDHGVSCGGVPEFRNEIRVGCGTTLHERAGGTSMGERSGKSLPRLSGRSQIVVGTAADGTKNIDSRVDGIRQ